MISGLPVTPTVVKFNDNAPTVGLFATCLVDLVRPQIGFAAAKLLEAAGCVVEVPKSQTCCGQPLFNSGDAKRSRKIALQFLNQFRLFDYVVVPSGSCAAMVTIHYPELFMDDPKLFELSEMIALKTYELTQFLDEVVHFPVHAQYEGTCTYHDSCSGFRELGIQSQPRRLIAQVDGLSLVECQESAACCGFGGTFCVKYPQISARIATEKAQNIEQTGAQTLLGGDLGCLMNISGTLSRRNANIHVRHVAEVLAETSGPAIGRSDS